MILSDHFLFAIALADTGAILFLLIYFVQVITLSDLECDYLNAQQCCSRLNQCVPVRAIAHGFLTSLLLLHGRWFLLLLNLPMLAWMVYEMATVRPGNVGVYDPTEIHIRGQISRHMKGCMIYVGYFLILFFIYLYCMIVALLKGDPINRKGEEEIVF